MSSHHRTSARVFDDVMTQKRKSVTRKVNFKLFGGNKFHSSYANWNPQNDLLRSSFTATSLNGQMKLSARLNSNNNKDQVVNSANEFQLQKILA